MMARALAGIGLTSLLLGALGCSGGAQPREGDGASPARSYVQLGVGYIRNGRLEVAHEKLQRALELDPDLALAHSTIAFLYQRLGNRDSAREHYERALELDPDDPSANNNYGQFLCRVGEYNKALKHFEKAVAQPFYETPQAAYTNAGTCARQIPAPERAERYLRSALKIDPELPDALLQMARLQYDRGKYLSARGFLQRFEEVSQPTPESLWLGLRVERELGDEVAAQGYAAQLTDKFPESRQAQRLEGARDDG